MKLFNQFILITIFAALCSSTFAMHSCCRRVKNSARKTVEACGDAIVDTFPEITALTKRPASAQLHHMVTGEPVTLQAWDIARHTPDISSSEHATLLTDRGRSTSYVSCDSCKTFHECRGILDPTNVRRDQTTRGITLAPREDAAPIDPRTAASRGVALLNLNPPSELTCFDVGNRPGRTFTETEKGALRRLKYQERAEALWQSEAERRPISHTELETADDRALNRFRAMMEQTGKL